MKWQDPPAEANRTEYGARYADEAEQLRAHPGQWAVLTSFGLSQSATARTTAARIRTGGFAVFRPAGQFESRTAKEGTRVNVYVRYIGGQVGNATRTEETTEPATEEESDTAVLGQLKVAELRGLARDLRISGYANMRKEELVKIIEERTGDG